MRWVLIVGVLLLIAACVNEQVAVPIVEDNSTVEPVVTVTMDATGPVVTKNKTENKTVVKVVKNETADVVKPAVNNTLDFVCLDTDKGEKPNEKGSLQYNLGNGTIIYKTDDCLGDSVREWWCDRGEISKSIYECKNGCFDGACKS